MNFFKILDKNKNATINLSINESCAVLCALSNAQINNAFARNTLKLTVSGQAIYQLNHNTYRLAEDEYLISSGEQEGVGFIESQGEVSQFCIHIMPSLINDTYHIISSSDKYDLEKKAHDSNCSYFFENVYNINSSLPVSNYLRPVVKLLKYGRENEVQLNEEWMFDLTELIVLNEIKLRWAETGLNAVKKSTRDEILRRLIHSREYMDTYFMTDPAIREISKVANMSECLFYRCFKQAFRITPYQYILNKKIEMSKGLVLKTNMKLSDIAFSAGFPDLYTFSKAFKRKYKYAPSQIRK